MDVLQENLYDSDEDSDEDDTWTESEVDKPSLWVSECRHSEYDSTRE